MSLLEKMKKQKIKQKGYMIKREREKDISPLYSVEWIKKTSFLLAIES
jgi:hypothetical protein